MEERKDLASKSLYELSLDSSKPPMGITAHLISSRMASERQRFKMKKLLRKISSVLLILLYNQYWSGKEGTLTPPDSPYPPPGGSKFGAEVAHTRRARPSM